MLRKQPILLAVAAACLLATVPALSFGQTKEDPQKLIGMLQSNASEFEKAKACQKLAVAGTKEAVPVLAALLSDEKLAHYARFGLEPIPDSSVDDAFRAALGQLKGKRLVGVINSIGVRRDAKAVPALADLLKDVDPQVAASAAMTLGRIGAPQSAELLVQALKAAPEGLKAAMADACFTCAETLAGQGNQSAAAAIYDAVRQMELPKYLRIAAMHGAIRARKADGVPLLVEQLRSSDLAMFHVALRQGRLLPGSEVTQAMIAELGKLTPERQALLIQAIGDRRDTSALPTVLEAAKSGPIAVRVAALRVLRLVGNASAVPVLVEAAGQTEADIAKAAQEVLAGLRGKEVDDAIVAALGLGDRRVRVLLIDLAGQRLIASATPSLFKAADDADEQIRLAAIKALGRTVTLENLPALTSRLLSSKTKQETAAVKDALKAACLRSPDREACADRLIASLPEASIAAKGTLFELLGSVGGAKALKAVAACARDANPQVQDAATRVLGEWMSADAAPDLLDLSKNAASEKFKIRALRGYIRIIRQLDVPAEKKVAMAKQAMAVAERDEEKKLVLGAVARVRTPEALAYAVSYLGDAKLNGDAAASAVAIGDKIVQAHPTEVKEAMDKVLKVVTATDVSNKAKTVLKRASEKK